MCVVCVQRVCVVHGVWDCVDGVVCIWCVCDMRGIYVCVTCDVYGAQCVICVCA